MQLYSKYKPHKPHGTINLYIIIIVSRRFEENHCTRGTIPYTLKQDAFFEKLSRRFACKTDTSVGHYRWLKKICSVASYSSEISQILAHAAILMKDFTVCQQANTSQYVAPIYTIDYSVKGALVIP